ncbi:MAG: maleylpyruvate isomerase N-terminal domain-containing protein [Candidatus Dormibacteria bacterium]
MDEARSALRASALRTAGLLAGIQDTSRPTSNLTWTVGETGAHLLVALRAYTDSLTGAVDRWAGHIPDVANYHDRMAAVTTGTLTSVPERAPGDLAQLLPKAVDGFLAASDGRSGEDRVATPWYGSTVSLPLRAATCLLLGEQVIHGGDIARAVGTPWPIRRDDAVLIIEAVRAMMPVLVDTAASREATIACAIHVRRASEFMVRVRHGTVTVEPLDAQRVDCHLSADPVAFVKVAYGRMGQWEGILRGGLLSWGRKPWVALRFRGLFLNP